MVTCEVDGVGLPELGEDGGGVEGVEAGVLPPPPQPVIAPRLTMQTTAKSAPRRYLLLLRTPAKPRRLSGNSPASTTEL